MSSLTTFELNPINGLAEMGGNLKCVIYGQDRWRDKAIPVSPDNFVGRVQWSMQICNGKILSYWLLYWSFVPSLLISFPCDYITGIESPYANDDMYGW